MRAVDALPAALASDRPRSRDEACVEFLRWALPLLRLRWRGFRRVRRQVCRRIQGRVRALGLDGLDAYRGFLEGHPEEWARLDALCTVSVSRFRRDRAVFDALAETVLPRLAAGVRAAGRRRVSCWSVGCASGEEPYGLKILWEMERARRWPDLELRILATDVDATRLGRAEAGRYPASSLKELPTAWREAAFDLSDGHFVLRPRFREGVELRRADLRGPLPGERFDLVLCRNLAFTYFDEALQLEVAERLAGALRPGGALVLGLHEELPDGARGFTPWNALRSIHRREEMA